MLLYAEHVCEYVLYFRHFQVHITVSLHISHLTWHSIVWEWDKLGRRPTPHHTGDQVYIQIECIYICIHLHGSGWAGYGWRRPRASTILSAKCCMQKTLFGTCTNIRKLKCIKENRISTKAKAFNGSERKTISCISETQRKLLPSLRYEANFLENILFAFVSGMCIPFVLPYLIFRKRNTETEVIKISQW